MIGFIVTMIGRMIYFNVKVLLSVVIVDFGLIIFEAVIHITLLPLLKREEMK